MRLKLASTLLIALLALTITCAYAYVSWPKPLPRQTYYIDHEENLGPSPWNKELPPDYPKGDEVVFIDLEVKPSEVKVNETYTVVIEVKKLIPRAFIFIEKLLLYEDDKLIWWHTHPLMFQDSFKEAINFTKSRIGVWRYKLVYEFTWRVWGYDPIKYWVPMKHTVLVDVEKVVVKPPVEKVRCPWLR
ncbi:MAG: hypothetical protein DRO09_00640 [Thermoprotei archaeon]|nr:MAG: hypothetical protein DRO09_00640 [Thermoprotei archaeon]